MAGAVKGRTYDSTRRREQARENRARILAAARRRFVEHGYAATTIPAVADDAGVSGVTVYKAFGNKAGLLKAVFDVAIAGDDQPVPIVERETTRALQAENDPGRKLRSYAEQYAIRAARAVPIQLLARDAASHDPAAAGVWSQMLDERLKGMAEFARHLSEDGHLRPGLHVDEARDVLWTFISPELWDLLVVQRGWTPEHYGHWMGQMLVGALLPETPPQARRRPHRTT